MKRKKGHPVLCMMQTFYTLISQELTKEWTERIIYKYF